MEVVFVGFVLWLFALWAIFSAGIISAARKHEREKKEMLDKIAHLPPAEQFELRRKYIDTLPNPLKEMSAAIQKALK